MLCGVFLSCCVCVVCCVLFVVRRLLFAMCLFVCCLVLPLVVCCLLLLCVLYSVRSSLCFVFVLCGLFCILKKKKFFLALFMSVFVICCWCSVLLVVGCYSLYAVDGWLLVFGCLWFVARCVCCCVVLCGV